MNFVDRVKFDSHGLVVVVAQDFKSKDVLMVAYMNRESLERTINEGIACYWSRSRQKLWVKGETSGNKQKVKEIRIDCDRDAIVLLVEQKGGACHTGYDTCFFTRYKDGKEEIVGTKVFNPDEVYS